MQNDYKICYKGGEGEIEEKKSRFIAHITPVHSEEEATAFIASIKKQYWDARHNVSAFAIGERNELTRSSDDGEPAGTAGRPLLDVILSSNIHDICIVVTRYFGGILLGTGGLVRAYQQAAKAGLEACEIISPTNGYEITISCDYTMHGKVEYYLREQNFIIDSTDFDIGVTIHTHIPSEKLENTITAIADRTAGGARVEKSDEIKYAYLSSGVITF